MDVGYDLVNMIVNMSVLALVLVLFMDRSEDDRWKGSKKK